MAFKNINWILFYISIIITRNIFQRPNKFNLLWILNYILTAKNKALKNCFLTYALRFKNLTLHFYQAVLKFEKKCDSNCFQNFSCIMQLYNPFCPCLASVVINHLGSLLRGCRRLGNKSGDECVRRTARSKSFVCVEISLLATQLRCANVIF